MRGRGVAPYPLAQQLDGPHGVLLGGAASSEQQPGARPDGVGAGQLDLRLPDLQRGLRGVELGERLGGRGGSTETSRNARSSRRRGRSRSISSAPASAIAASSCASAASGSPSASSTNARFQCTDDTARAEPCCRVCSSSCRPRYRAYVVSPRAMYAQMIVDSRRTTSSVPATARAAAPAGASPRCDRPVEVGELGQRHDDPHRGVGRPDGTGARADQRRADAFQDLDRRLEVAGQVQRLRLASPTRAARSMSSRDTSVAASSSAAVPRLPDSRSRRARRSPPPRPGTRAPDHRRGGRPPTRPAPRPPGPTPRRRAHASRVRRARCTWGARRTSGRARPGSAPPSRGLRGRVGRGRSRTHDRERLRSPAPEEGSHSGSASGPVRHRGGDRVICAGHGNLRSPY